MRKTIGFLGCGNMGGAIARAVCKAADPQSVWLANRTPAKAEALAAELGCNTTSNDEVAGRCDLIFLAVKPQMMEELLAPLRFTLAERPGRFVLCSMAAGLSIGRIQEMAGGDYPVIRIMPNTPASVGAGMIQYCTSGVTAGEKADFLRLMAPAGRLDAVPEALIDAASCVSGCGPAWVYQFIVIPCYNEEQVLPITAPLFLKKISDLAAAGLVSEKSRVLFVNDGSRDATWSLIQRFSAEDEHFIGISQSRNRGHQNAVLAGLMEALHSGSCDITISIDCDGQDDINAMDEMVKKYLDGAEVVYGVRSRRDTDTFFKRFTAEGFYHVMNALGADIVFNHADYRLISTRVLESFADYKEVNIFLRGMVPLVGFPHDVVTYERHERLAGESHYPLSKMLALAFDGITSLSNKPIRIITGAGIVVSLVSFIGVIWAIVCAAMGSSVAGWASTVCIVCFMGGVQLVCLGVIGEYIGKIYMETKARPRYIISERTWAPYERKYHG